MTRTTGSRETLARATPAALLVALLLAGCGGGGGDKAAFKRDYPPINQDLVALGSDVGQALSGAAKRRDAAIAGEFKGFAARLLTIKSRVDGLRPPDDLKAPATALSSAMDKLIDDLTAISTAATVHDATAARAATHALVQDSPALVAVRRKLAQATGAAVGP